MAVEKNGIVIGHLPRKVARVWIRKTVVKFQMPQQSHIHVPWIRGNNLCELFHCSNYLLCRKFPGFNFRGSRVPTKIRVFCQRKFLRTQYTHTCTCTPVHYLHIDNYTHTVSQYWWTCWSRPTATMHYILWELSFSNIHIPDVHGIHNHMYLHTS